MQGAKIGLFKLIWTITPPSRYLWLQPPRDFCFWGDEADKQSVPFRSKHIKNGWNAVFRLPANLQT